MSDQKDKDLDDMIDGGEKIISDDILKGLSTDKGIRSQDEGYIYKFCAKTPIKHKTDKDVDVDKEQKDK